MISLNKQEQTTTYFKLVGAESLTKMSPHSSQRIYRFSKNVPTPVSDQRDIMVFRRQPDTFMECDAAGNRFIHGSIADRLSSPPVGGTPLSKRVFQDISKPKPKDPTPESPKNTMTVKNLPTETITAVIDGDNPSIDDSKSDTTSVSVEAEAKPQAKPKASSKKEKTTKDKK